MTTTIFVDTSNCIKALKSISVNIIIPENNSQSYATLFTLMI